MPGFDWNGNGKKDSFDHYIDMKVTSDLSKDSDSSHSDVNERFNSTNNGMSGNRNNKNSVRFGWGWGVIVVVVIMLIFFIADGASWDAIDTLLGLGLLAFLFFRWIST